jgi:polysaccharide pyruvyl transferase WcaK-like protein
MEFTSEYILGDAMKIFILFHGFGNVGDFAIFKGTLRVLREVAPGAGITVVDPKPVPNTYLDDYVAWVSYHRLFHGLFERVMAHTVSMAQLVSGLKPVADYEHGEGILWHKGGSGYDGYHGSIPLLLSATSTLSVARLFGYKILGGLSLGFYRNGFEKNIIRNFADGWNYILVREPYSKYYLTSAGVDEGRVLLVHDFAFHIGEKCSKRVKELVGEIRNYDSKPRIAVSIRDYYYDHDPMLYNSYIQFIGRLLKTLTREFHVFLIPMAFSGRHENDIKFAKRLLEDRVIPDSAVPLYSVAYMDPEEVVCLLRNFDVSISVRTHFCILSAVAGIPMIHLYYEHKGRGIFRYSLRDSLPNISLYRAIHDSLTTINQIVNHIHKLIDEKNNVRRDLEKIIQNNRLHNQKIVKQILHEQLKKLN